MNNPITRTVDKVTGAAGDLTSGLADKATGIKNSVTDATNSALDYAVSLRDIKRNPPTQVTIADLFHKKLYNYADFDFLIEYLRTNGIATCKDIHTITTLSKDIIPSLTESALKARDVRKVNAAYAGIMRLCRRRRRGMLAYLSVDGHAQVCLIKSWDRFQQLAGFNNAATADKLTFNTVDVFPSLRINKTINAHIAKYNEQAIEERRARAAAKRESVLLAKEELQEDYKSLEDLADVMITNTTNNSVTSLFKAGQDVDFAQILAMNYTKVCTSGENLVWDDEHAADYFLYFLVSKGYPTYKSIKSIKDFFSHVSEMFSSVGFALDAKKIQQLSGGRLRDLRNAFRWSTVEAKSEVDRDFDKALMSLAVKLLLFDVNTTASYQDIYTNELTRISNKKQQIATQIKSITTLIDIPNDNELAEYTQFEPDFQHLVDVRNAEIFRGIWNEAVTGKLADLTEDGFDKIACLLIYDKTKKSTESLADFDNDLIVAINELSSDNQVDWSGLFPATSGDIFKACRISRGIRSASSACNAAARHLLCDALSKFYNFKVNEHEMWQQIYMGICNAKKGTPKSGLTVTSAAEALGLADGQNDDMMNDVMSGLDDMDLNV